MPFEQWRAARIPLALGTEFVRRQSPGESTVERVGNQIWPLPTGTTGQIADDRVLLSAQRHQQEKRHFRGVSSVVFDVRDRSVREIDPACTVAAAVDEAWLLSCEREGRSTIESIDWSGGTRELVPPPPGSAGFGHWVRVLISPDGSTLLAQWSGECEVPTAFLVPTTGGTARPVTGENGLEESVGLGWSPDGRAVVYVPQGTCGPGTPVPGLYLVSLAGAATLVYATPNSDFSMQMWAPLP
jgi:hypothetical protein